ncbi:hypothetical protein RclHR1_08190007 [Rhizophagus clarus]|uniref:ADP-ribosylation n=1 Tax=Rhizophagus clarus TaxID=94130 RepID=A0A2Z6S1Z8_9GLOM|nr:hypothetical protein RclHR1_08190007 [Rhizophagus clarus]GES81539.1 ADP-ribosylation [Rhizophagus clarus]
MPTCLYCGVNESDKDPNRYDGEYCSDFCRVEISKAKNKDSLCIQCKLFPRVNQSFFCGKMWCRNCMSCNRRTILNSNTLWCGNTCRDSIPNWRNLIELPRIVKLETYSYPYKSILKQWKESWKSCDGEEIPKIKAIWEIIVAWKILRRYEAYRNEVERTGHFDALIRGNEQRRFHGSSQACLLGIANSNLCDSTSCSTCQIIRHSYRLPSSSYGAFGCGIYFTANSSKSNWHNRGSRHLYNGTWFRTVLLNLVVVGRWWNQLEFKRFVAPPRGYHSIIGEPSDEGRIKLDELVVYTEAACIPRYLIVYKELEKEIPRL